MYALTIEYQQCIRSGGNMGRGENWHAGVAFLPIQEQETCLNSKTGKREMENKIELDGEKESQNMNRTPCIILIDLWGSQAMHGK